jgi:hypothetical protein
VTRDDLGVRAESAGADDGVRGDVDVGDRCQVPVHAHRGEIGGKRAANRFRRVDVVEPPERGSPGIRAALAPLEARDVAALLVGGEQEIGTLVAERPAEPLERLRALDVVGEQHDAAASLGEEAADPLWRRRARKAREDARGRELALRVHQRT